MEKLSFTTVDRTPPKFNTNATVNKVERTSVGLYANLNEAGTLVLWCGTGDRLLLWRGSPAR